jgi:hypothetical protein
LSADAAAGFQPSVNLEKAGGSFSVSRSFLRASVGYAFDRRNRVLLSLGAGITSYDFDVPTSLGSTAPWGSVQDLRLNLPLSFAATEKVTGFIIPGVRWNAETAASFDDGRTEGVRAGFSYRFNENFMIGPGIGWFTSLGGGSNIFPILLFDWRVTDTLRISTGRGLAASQGPGLKVSYKLKDSLILGVEVRSESRSFRLDESGPAPSGIGKDKGFPLIATVGYRPSPNFRISAFAGVKFAGELKLENASGAELATSDYDLAPIFGLSLSGRF